MWYSDNELSKLKKIRPKAYDRKSHLHVLNTSTISEITKAVSDAKLPVNNQVTKPKTDSFS